MLNNFKLLLIIVVIAGLSAGAAFGAGAVYSRTIGAKPTTAAAPAAANSGQTGTNSATGGAAADAFGRGGIRGSIDSLDGDIVTIKSSDGTTTKIKLDSKATIRKTVDGTKDDLKPGENILVTGDRGADGTLTASQISVVPAGSAQPGAGPAAGRTPQAGQTPSADRTPGAGGGAPRSKNP